MKRFIRSVLSILFMCCFTSSAFAVCTNNEDGQPGVGGEIEYFTATNKLMYCDDTEWVEMTFIAPILPDSSTDFDSYLQFFANAVDNFFANDTYAFFVNGEDHLFVNLYHQFFAQSDATSEGLIGYWKLDETSGTIAYDSSGNGHNGVYEVDASNFTREGVVNNSIKPTQSSKFTVTNTAFDNLSAFSLCYWIRSAAYGGPGSTGHEPIVKPNGFWIDGYRTGTQHDFQRNGWSQVDRDSTNLHYQDEDWRHHCVTFDESQSPDASKIYTNGVETTTGTSGAGTSTDDSGTTITFGTSSLQDTYFDEVRFYNRAITPSEVLEIYSDVPGYAPEAVEFDGTNDYLNATALMADSQQITGSLWVRNNDGGDYRFFEGNASSFFIRYENNYIRFVGENNAGTFMLGCDSSTSYGDNDWHHILFSFDLSNVSNQHIYIDDAEDPASCYLYSNDTINLDETFYLGSDAGLSAPFNGDMSDVWIDSGTYIDLSIEANRRKFISSDGTPAFLGSDGSLPTGSQPDIFLFGNTDYWHRNKGPGGGLTENGALTSAGEVTPPGVIAWWKLDETSGSTITDSSPNGNDGTWTDGGDNDVSGETVTGIDGTALNFGSADINAGSDASVDNIYSGGGMSVCAWIYPESVPGAAAPIVNKNGPSFGNYGWSVYLNRAGGNTIEFYTNLDSYIAPNVTYQLNQWQHICFTWDGSEGTAGLTSYVNGVEPSGTTYLGDDSATVFDDSAYDIHIGFDDSASTVFDGTIDDVRIYNRVISASEVAAIYDGTEDGPTLVGHWKLDETSGTTAFDSSSYGNDGTYDAGTTLPGDSEEAVFDTAVNFKAANHVRISSSSHFTKTGELTASAWIKPTDDNYSLKGILGLDGVFDFNVRNSGNEIGFSTDAWSTDGSWSTDAANPVVPGKWTHVAVTYDYNNILNDPVFYVDGQVTAITQNVSNSGSLNLPAAAPGYIGRRTTSSGSQFNGLIDDARIYNRVLSATEIEDLYNEANSALVGHWKLDETSGTTAVDSSQYGNDGTMLGGLDASSHSVDGIVSTALNTVNNAGHYIQVPHSSSLDITGEDITISAWINVQSDQYNSIISKEGTGVSVFHIDKSNNSSDWNCNITTSSGEQSVSFGFSGVDRWDHIVCSYNGSNITVYVNGVQVAQNAATGTIASEPTADLYIGKTLFNGFNRELLGKIDDVRIYNRALTASEILELYNKANESLVGYWKLDETSGTTAVDSSQYGNDGSMNGGLDAANDSVDGVIDTSISFDGTNDDIDLSTLQVPISNGITMAAWIKPSKTDQLDGIVRNRNNVSGSSDNAAGLIFGPSNNITELNKWTWNNGLTVPQDEWSFVALTLDSSTTTVYLGDGTNATLQSASSATSGGDYGDGGTMFSGFVIGDDSGFVNREYGGEIDDVRIYNRVLTASELQELYSQANGSLIGHWKLDETSGTTAADSSGNGLDGTMLGTLNASNDSVDGVIDTSLSFGGLASDDEISITDTSLDLEEFSFSIWVKSLDEDCGVADFNCPGIVRKIVGNPPSVSTNTGWYIIQKNGSARLNTLDADGTTYRESNSIKINDGKWHHIVYTRDSSKNNILYVDGVANTPGTDTYNVATTAPLRIGAELSNASGGAAWDGEMDDARYYDRALTAAEVLELYNKANENLIGHWKLDETSGTTAVDSSQYGNNGNMTGGLDAGNDSRDGVIDNALRFDGSNGLINIPDDSSLHLPLPVTISAWINPESTGNDMGIFGSDRKGNTRHSGVWLMVKDAGNIQAGYGDNTGCTSTNRRSADASGNVELNKWQHVLAVIKGPTDIDIYVDGVLDSSPTYTGSGGSIAYTSNDSEIGSLDNCGAGDNVFDGRIDDVRVYNRELNSTEIQELYNQADGALIGHWKLDETSGTTAADSSVNNNNGTWTGATPATITSGDGIIDNAFDFDGDNDYVDFGSDSSINNVYQKGATISSWVYARSRGDNSIGRIYSKHEFGAGNIGHRLHFNSSRELVFKHSFDTTSGQWETTTALDFNKWYHIAVTYDCSSTANDPIIYINGVADTLSESSAPAGTCEDDASQPFVIGARNNGSRSWDGLIDDMRMYNKILTATEIQELYENSIGGLVAHYRLDESSGTTAIDSTPNGNDGTMAGGLDASNNSVDGPMNSALDFDGADDFVSGIPFGSGELGTQNTFAYWAKLDSNSRLAFGRNGENCRIAGITKSGNLQYAIECIDSANLSTPAGVDLSEWNHLAFVRNETNVDFYINGVLEGSDTLGANDAVRIDQFARRGGESGSGDFGDGQADDLRIYNRALSATEILDLYNVGDPPVAGGGYDLNDGLVGYWTLDETSGTTAADSSGNGNDGTMTGSLTGASSVSGVVNNALNFDENPGTDRIDIPDTGMPTGTNPPFSMGGWFKVQENSPQTAARWTLGYGDTSDATNDAQIIFDRDANIISYQVGATAQGSTVPNYLNKWMHVFLTFDGTTARLYQNGTQIRSDAAAISPVSSYGAIGGRIGGGADYNGDIDDVRMYNRALDPAEVEILAGCTGPGSYYYNFSDDVMQWCDGVASAYDMGPKPGSTNTACNYPTGFFDNSEGTLQYIGSLNNYYYCDGANQIPIGRGCTNCGGSSTEKVVFYLDNQTVYAGNFGGLTGADALCQAEADANGLSGTYLAWLADSTNSPDTRFTKATVPYIQPNGDQIASNWTTLTDGNIDTPLEIMANGARAAVVASRNITNVDDDGTAIGSDHCGDYVSTGLVGAVGDAGDLNAWTNRNQTGACNNGDNAILYCFEQ